MSVELMVFMRRATLPSSRSWARAVNDTGFALSLDGDFDTEKFSGYLPCRYQGAPSGFEYHAAPVTDDERAAFDVPAELDFVVTLATRGDESELACSVIALGVLCSVTNGLLYDPQSGMAISPDEAMDWVNEMVKQLGN